MTAKDIMTTTTTFTVGQKVAFTVVRQTGRTIKFSSREGRVQGVNGDSATIKAKNGSLHAVHLSDLRAVGERNALTDAILSSLGV